MVLMGLEVEVMVVDKTEGKVKISLKHDPEIASVVHDCRIGVAEHLILEKKSVFQTPEQQPLERELLTQHRLTNE